VDFADGTTRNAETLLKNADGALYQAKAAGRDRRLMEVLKKSMFSRLRRVLKGRSDLFNGGPRVIDCTVPRFVGERRSDCCVHDCRHSKSFNLSIAAAT
jgi:hypothetical protein